MTKSELLDSCIDKLGISKSETVLIGDSKYDAIGAMQSGIAFIAVTYGFGFKSSDDIEEYPHICLCNSVKELGFNLL